MSNAGLVYPMFAMVVLTAVVLVTLFRRRVRAVREKQLPVGYFSTFQGAVEPEFTAQASRHFTNLFEAPTLFYVVCVATIATSEVTIAMVVLAWAYVAARLVHAYIHLGTNRIGNRIRTYFSGWLILAAMWVMLVVNVTAAGA